MHGKCGLFYTTYGQEDQLFPSKFQKACLGGFMALLLASPVVLNTYAMSILCLINISIIGAVSLMLLTGYCGQISLGHGAFLGVGAYTSAKLTGMGVPFIPALVGGGLVTAFVGMVFGIPSLRLKGIYLAIATLAAQLILEYVFLHWRWATGGGSGMMVFPPTIFGYAFDSDVKMFYLTLAVAVCVVLLVTNVTRTRPGRAYVAIRDYYLSAEIVGVNLFACKLQAFGVSSFFAGVAGGLWAHYTMYITPEQFNIGVSISYLAMIIIGGLGSIQGAVFGAAFIVLLPEGLNYLADFAGAFFPDVSTYFMALKHGVFGLVLVLFLIFEPEGLVHRWRLIKAYWKLYPFAH